MRDELNNSLVALSSSPTDPTCVVALARFDGFAICRPGDQEPHWKRCRRITCVMHYFFKRPGGICDVTFCNDKFYWLTEAYYLISLDCDTGHIDVLYMDKLHLPGWHRSHSAYTLIALEERLLEYQGEILLVLVCNLDCRVVDRPPMIQIKVFRADWGGKSVHCNGIPWVRVSSLGGKVAFISGKGRSILVNSASCFGAYPGDQICFAKPGSWKSLEQHWRPISEQHQSPRYQWR